MGLYGRSRGDHGNQCWLLGTPPCPGQSTIGGVGNVASRCGDSPGGGRGSFRERETGCLRSRSKALLLLGTLRFGQSGRDVSVLWLQGCPADGNWQRPSAGPPGQWEDHSSGCCLQPPRAPLAEGEGTWRVEPNCFPSPAQLLPPPSPLSPLATSLALTVGPQPSGSPFPLMLSS